MTTRQKDGGEEKGGMRRETTGPPTSPWPAWVKASSEKKQKNRASRHGGSPIRICCLCLHVYCTRKRMDLVEMGGVCSVVFKTNFQTYFSLSTEIFGHQRTSSHSPQLGCWGRQYNFPIFNVGRKKTPGYSGFSSLARKTNSLGIWTSRVQAFETPCEHSLQEKYQYGSGQQAEL